MAVTPGAQVHRGTLEGEPVAIKVLRPGLAASVRQDLALLEALAAPLGAAFPALDTSAVLREVRERVLEELDLESEATVQRRFARALRRHPFLSRARPDHPALPRGGAGQRTGSTACRSPRRPIPTRPRRGSSCSCSGPPTGASATPTPTPTTCSSSPDGGLAIVDFGACRPIDSERLRAATGVLAAVAARDAEALGGHLEAAGLDGGRARG